MNNFLFLVSCYSFSEKSSDDSNIEERNVNI